MSELPPWLPPPPPESKPEPTLALPYVQPSERDQEYADFGDWLSVIFGWVDDQERWARLEARIDQLIALRRDE